MVPMNDILKSALIGNILSAIVYNPELTLDFLEENGLSQDFIYELINND